jgi:hypothetical protein
MKSLTQILDKKETEFWDEFIRKAKMNDRANKIMTDFVWTVLAAIVLCAAGIIIGAWLVR